MTELFNHEVDEGEDHVLISSDSVKPPKESLASGCETNGDLFRVIFIGVLILIYSSSSNSGLIMVSQIFDHLGYTYLGQLNLLTIYFLGALGTLFAPMMVRLGRLRNIIFFSSFGYLIFLSCGAVACLCENNQNYILCEKSSIYKINIFGAAIAGLLISVFWTAQNYYVSSLGDSRNKGLYFGIAWGLIQSSQLVGNLASVFLLNKWSHLTYFCVISLVCFISIFGFLCVTNRPKTMQESTKEEKDLAHYQRRKLGDKLELYFDSIKNHRIQPLLYFMASCGVITAFFSGFFYEVIEKSIDKNLRKETINEQTSRVFIALGVMEIFGGLFVSKFADILPKVSLCKGANLAFQVALILAIFAEFFNEYSVCFFCGAFAGFADCTSQALMNAILGSEFSGTVEEFALFNQFQFIGGLCGLILIISLRKESRYIFILIALVFQFVTFYQLHVYEMKRNPGFKENKLNEDRNIRDTKGL